MDSGKAMESNKFWVLEEISVDGFSICAAGLDGAAVFPQLTFVTVKVITVKNAMVRSQGFDLGFCQSFIIGLPSRILISKKYSVERVFTSELNLVNLKFV